MDIFETWLKRKDSIWIKRALTDSSYNSYRCRGVRHNDPRYEELHTPLPVNTDLATYGDGVIKLCYLELMLDNEEQLTVAKSKVESDEYLVNVVARHYDLLSYINKDKDDDKLPDSYDYIKFKGTNKNPCKYIATAVEAVIGAIYKETKDLNAIIELLKSWRQL